MSKKEQRKAPVLRFKGFTDDWEQRKLGDIATFINGRAYSKNELLHQGKYKVLRVGNFYTNDSWYYSDMELDKKYYANYGDLLYTWSATFGPHIWKGEKVIYHYHIWKIILSDEITKNFTLQLLEHDKNRLLAEKNGSTMIHLTKKDMENKEIVIPSSTNEQDKVGLLLTKLDYLITLQQRKMDNLSKIQKSLENNLFPDINHVRKLKASKNNWHTKKLNNIFNERKKYDQYGQLLSVSMTKGVYPFNPSERKDNSSSNKSNYKVVRKGDIAYNSMRMWQGACGVSKYDGIVSPAYTVITPGSNEDASFYYYYFKNNRMKFKFRRHSQGLTSDTWNLKFPLFKDITIEVPNNEKEQIRIRKLLDTLNEAIKHGNGRIRKLKLLKSFLLQKMFI